MRVFAFLFALDYPAILPSRVAKIDLHQKTKPPLALRQVECQFSSVGEGP
ncbi:MAG: hypothetical protein Q4B10_04255 [Actinomycetaceae bacterium]|nr:hypothetical protein [Actinomycetaceae bacterium]